MVDKDEIRTEFPPVWTALWNLEGGLSSFACNAAINLYGLLKGNMKLIHKYISVQKLIWWISTKLLEEEDYEAEEIMREALKKSEFTSSSLDSREDIQRESNNLLKCLQAIIADPEECVRKDPGKIEAIEELCFLISNVASSYLPSLYDLEDEWGGHARYLCA